MISRILARLRCASLVVSVFAAVALAGLGHRPVFAKRNAPASAPRWHMTETRNFRIYSFAVRRLDPQLTTRCEELRTQNCACLACR